MKAIKPAMLLILLVFNGTAYAYGGGGGSSTKACTKPKFSEFKPAHMSEVAPQAEFSFLASSSTSPSTLEVTVKELPVEVAIEKTSGGYLVTGKLPESLSDTFARVKIEAKTTKKCFGSGGWLLKIQGT